MKTGKKTFDCVEMKNAIQARLAARHKGMCDSEILADIEKRLAVSKQPIAEWWRRISAEKGEGKKPHARSAASI